MKDKARRIEQMKAELLRQHRLLILGEVKSSEYLKMEKDVKNRIKELRYGKD